MYWGDGLRGTGERLRLRREVDGCWRSCGGERLRLRREVDGCWRSCGGERLRLRRRFGILYVVPEAATYLVEPAGLEEDEEEEAEELSPSGREDTFFATDFMVFSGGGESAIKEGISILWMMA
jgi:hypothetical protein